MVHAFKLRSFGFSYVLFRCPDKKRSSLPAALQKGARAFQNATESRSHFPKSRRSPGSSSSRGAPSQGRRPNGILRRALCYSDGSASALHRIPCRPFLKRAMCLSISFNYKRRVFPCQCPLAIFLKKAQEGLRKRAAPRTGAPRARRRIFLARDRPLQPKARLAEDGGGTPLRQSLCFASPQAKGQAAEQDRSLPGCNEMFLSGGLTQK